MNIPEAYRYKKTVNAFVWDAWHREFNSAGQLLNQTFCTWDNEYQAKAELYYDVAGEYLGKKVDSLKGGKYHPLYFDRNGNLLPSMDSIIQSSTFSLC